MATSHTSQGFHNVFFVTTKALVRTQEAGELPANCSVAVALCVYPPDKKLIRRIKNFHTG